ncbi:MAG: 50S ribosomal protein L13 [Clostridia bacterium]|nr:50S ribosomal protein L13 [Clostridia bacterium]
MSKTFMAKPADVQRKWYIVDAANRPLGRTAAKVADLLRGKVKPSFTPHVDCGDHVIVINADKAVLTGKKLENKYYRRHTGFIGGLKEVKYSTLMNTRPELAMELAVKGMVPDTTIGRKALTRLHIYAGENYAQVAQKPEKYEF